MRQQHRNYLFILGRNVSVCHGKDFVTNAELQSLISTLPRLIEAGVAASTKTKYQRSWWKWEQFCVDKSEVVSRPADPFFIAVYFNHLLMTTGTRGSIQDAMYGIRWGHISAGFYSPTDHPFVKLTYEGAIRLSNYSGTNKKDPVTASMLRHLIDTYSHQTDLMTQRFLLICLLGFAAFMRIEEMLDVKVKDITFYPKYMTINVPKSKNDQTREGNIIYVSEIRSRYCPVAHTAAYITIAKLEQSDFLICKLAKTKRGHNVVGSHQMSYSRIREVFLEFMRPHFPSINLGLHGLRAGGASAAAENQISDRLISKHGRWTSEKARDGYIKDSVRNRLEVTKHLGL